MKVITVLRLPGREQTVEMEGNPTVAECCAAAGFPTENYSCSLSDNPMASWESPVNDGATIVMTREAKGA